MRMRAWGGSDALVAVIVSGAVVAACQRPLAASVTRPTPVGAYTDVPPVAPESISLAKLDSLGKLPNSTASRIWWARSVIMLQFRAGASEADRRDVVRRLSGGSSAGTDSP